MEMYGPMYNTSPIDVYCKPILSTLGFFCLFYELRYKSKQFLRYVTNVVKRHSSEYEHTFKVSEGDNYLK